MPSLHPLQGGAAGGLYGLYNAFLALLGGVDG